MSLPVSDSPCCYMSSYSEFLHLTYSIVLTKLTSQPQGIIMSRMWDCFSQSLIIGHKSFRAPACWVWCLSIHLDLAAPGALMCACPNWSNYTSGMCPKHQSQVHRVRRYRVLIHSLVQRWASIHGTMLGQCWVNIGRSARQGQWAWHSAQLAIIKSRPCSCSVCYIEPRQPSVSQTTSAIMHHCTPPTITTDTKHPYTQSYPSTFHCLPHLPWNIQGLNFARAFNNLTSLTFDLAQKNT